ACWCPKRCFSTPVAACSNSGSALSIFPASAYARARLVSVARVEGWSGPGLRRRASRTCSRTSIASASLSASRYARPRTFSVVSVDGPSAPNFFTFVGEDVHAAVGVGHLGQVARGQGQGGDPVVDRADEHLPGAVGQRTDAAVDGGDGGQPAAAVVGVRQRLAAVGARPA